MDLPGYYNHCAICGFTAAQHYPQVGGKGSGYSIAEHNFVWRTDERMMSGAAPDWESFWRLEDRVRQLEEWFSQTGRNP